MYDQKFVTSQPQSVQELFQLYPVSQDDLMMDDRSRVIVGTFVMARLNTMYVLLSSFESDTDSRMLRL